MEQNAVNDAATGVVAPQNCSEPALAPERAGTESENAERYNAKRENVTHENVKRENAPRGQAAETNSGFAAMRRENERLSRELSEAKRLADLAGTSGEQALAARKEAYVLQGVVSRQRFESDLAEIKSRFPEVKAADITELGEQFLRLRAAGVDNLVAYAAANASKTPAVKPPETGAVGAAGAPEKEYYSPAEVDRLGKKELGDPKILSRVQKSMTKWRREP